MTKTRIKLESPGYPLFGLAVLLTGMIAHGPVTGPDVEYSKVQLLGVFLVFISFLLSVIGWGSLASKRLGLSGPILPAARLALGTAISSVAAQTLGHLGLIGYEFSPLAVLW